MPKDTISGPRQAPALATDDADDEVIDLLEVVKPGRDLKRDSGRDEGDFSADLDAMLDGLSEVGAPEIPERPTPFPDPTPVDYKVDHNETLDLPGMDDLDNLLKSFGASGEDRGRDETEEPEFAVADLDLPDLDALPAPPALSPKGSPAASAPAASGRGGAPSAGTAAQAARPARLAPDEDPLLASLLAEEDEAPVAGKKGDDTEFAPAADEEEDLFADLLALGENDTPVADGKAAPAPAGEKPPFAGNPIGVGELPALEEDADALAGGDSLLPGDLNFDDPDPKDEKPAHAPAGGDQDEDVRDLDLFLADGGTDDAGGAVLAGADLAAADAADFPDAAAEKRQGAPIPDERGGPDRDAGDSAPPEPASEPRAKAAPQSARIASLPLDDPAGAAEAAASRFEEVDLNELDALLDDMLATAPASGPGPAAATAGPPAPLDAPADPGSDAPAQSVIPSYVVDAEDVPDLEAVHSRLDGQEDAARDLRRQLAGQEASLAEQKDKTRELNQRFSEHEEEMRELIQRFSGALDQVRDLQQRLDGLAGADNPRLEALADRVERAEALASGMEQRLADLAGTDDPRSQALVDRVEQLEAQLGQENARREALEARIADLLANMDKLAAETAARVIREELAALVESMA